MFLAPQSPNLHLINPWYSYRGSPESGIEKWITLEYDDDDFKAHLPTRYIRKATFFRIDEIPEYRQVVVYPVESKELDPQDWPTPVIWYEGRMEGQRRAWKPSQYAYIQMTPAGPWKHLLPPKKVDEPTKKPKAVKKPEVKKPKKAKNKKPEKAKDCIVARGCDPDAEDPEWLPGSDEEEDSVYSDNNSDYNDFSFVG